jgi:hypothetical protein
MARMNSHSRPSVEGRMPKSVAVITVAFGLLANLVGSTACVEIDGGAVELSWLVRDFDGEPNNCRTPGIDQIVVNWQALDSEMQPTEFRDVHPFSCSARRGVTGFDIPEGLTSLHIVPVCANTGQAAEGPYEVPPPIVRHVGLGEVVTLNQLLVVASDEECEGETCTCPSN